jgi:hypothetical protein
MPLRAAKRPLRGRERPLVRGRERRREATEGIVTSLRQIQPPSSIIFGM